MFLKSRFRFTARVTSPIFSLFLISILLGACAHSPKENTPEEVKKVDTVEAVKPDPVKTVQAAKEVASKEFIIVRFPVGRYNLTEAEKQKLAAWSVNVPERGKVAEFEILAWPDKEYPAEDKKVSSKDIRLAEDRAKQIREFFKKDLITKADLNIHNMAKRPGVFSEMFQTEDFQVKNTFEDTGAAPTNETAQNLKTENKASKAVVLVKYE